MVRPLQSDLGDVDAANSLRNRMFCSCRIPRIQWSTDPGLRGTLAALLLRMENNRVGWAPFNSLHLATSTMDMLACNSSPGARPDANGLEQARSRLKFLMFLPSELALQERVPRFRHAPRGVFIKENHVYSPITASRRRQVAASVPSLLLTGLALLLLLGLATPPDPRAIAARTAPPPKATRCCFAPSRRGSLTARRTIRRCATNWWPVAIPQGAS